MKKISLVTLFFLVLFVLDASAAKRYWISSGGGKWNNTANWSASSGGSGGSSVPSTNDTAYFDGNGTGNDTLDMNISVKRLDMAAGYTGTIVQGSYTVTLGTGGAILSGGTFAGGSGSIAASGAFTISGTAFTSTSGTFSATANFTFSSGSFTHNNGKLKFSVTNTITGSMNLYQLEFAPSATSTYTIASGTTLTVLNTLTMSGSNTATINTGNINAEGDVTITNSGTGGGGSYTLTLTGSNNQTLTAPSTQGQGRFANVTINKTGGTLSLSGLLTVNGNWIYSSGTINAGTSTVLMAGTKTISGTHTLYHVIFASGGTFSVSDTITSAGTLTIQGTIAITINTGVLKALGDITVTNSATTGGGSATILISGTNVQTLTGNGSASQGRLPKIVIDKTGGRLDLSSVISVANNWTYIQGEVKPNTSSVALYGTINLDGEGTTAIMSFYNLAVGSGTTSITGNLDVDNNLTIASGTTLSASSYTIYVGGQWNSQGTWTYSTSTVVFDGSGYKQVTGLTGTTINFYNVTFNKTNHSLTLSRPVKINNAMVLTKGHIKTTSTNYLELPDNATCTGGGIGAYVHGPVRKTGNDAFTFPLGDTTLSDSAAFHPLAITAPSVSTDQFEATYFAVGQTVGDSLVDSLVSISSEEYWTLERKAGTSNIYARVGWNSNSDINNVGSLRLAGWNGTKWLDYGRADFSISWPTGIIGSSIVINFPANPIKITIGNSKPVYYGYGTMKRKLDGAYYETKDKSLYFRFEDEYNDQNHHLSYKVYNEANSNVAPTLIYNSNNDPLSYYGDNRFKLDLYTSSGALHNGFYILEVTNEKEEKFYLRFHIN